MTPESINDKVRLLVERVGIGSEPIYLNVEPEDFCKVINCFPNVEEKIKRDGGSRVLDWQLWDHKYMVEAELHSVWLSKDGKYNVYAHADGYSYFQGTVNIDDEGLTSFHIKLTKVE